MTNQEIPECYPMNTTLWIPIFQCQCEDKCTCYAGRMLQRGFSSPFEVKWTSSKSSFYSGIGATSPILKLFRSIQTTGATESKKMKLLLDEN